ncbi:hypothetical protein ACH4SP_11180 [Streptomyces sp. NPDC021093]|uniref:hypothetical protein n=1 Tax=Streptomyces sp. NPDC021093 TaxID=3365112 RepID=UPI00378BB8E5
MKHLLVRACTAVAVASIATAGCTAQGPDGSGTTAKDEAPPRVRELTDADRLVLNRAERLHVRDCMTRQGHSYWVGLPPGADESRSTGYLSTDVGWAKRHGYGSRITAKVLKARRTNPNVLYRERLSPSRLHAYDSALEGGRGTAVLKVRVPSGATISSRLGGCEAEAQEWLYGDLKTWFRVSRIATNLTPLYASRLMRDPEFTTAQSAWAACMRRGGNNYATPTGVQDALPSLTRGLPEKKAFAVEVRLAVAEATCAGSSGLAGTGSRLERHYVNGLRGEYGDVLDDYARLERTALTRARTRVTPSTPVADGHGRTEETP